MPLGLQRRRGHGLTQAVDRAVQIRRITLQRVPGLQQHRQDVQPVGPADGLPSPPESSHLSDRTCQLRGVPGVGVALVAEPRQVHRDADGKITALVVG